MLGMDWLEKYSPMWVDWKRKRMRFSYQGSRITLTGVKDCLSRCLPLKTSKLKGLLKKGKVAQLVQLMAIAPHPAEQIIHKDTGPAVQQMLADYDQLFQKPTQLPLAREFDHSIPLIEGVKPVNIKPYRYSPT